MANNYWGDKEEALCIQWNNSGNTQHDYTRIYNELHAPLYQMAESIMNRYFSVPAARQTDLKRDILTEVFTKLKHFNPEKSKSYSFCSLLIKHYIMETQVLQPQYVKHPQLILTSTGEFTDDYYRAPIEYTESYKVDFDAVINHFKTLKKKVVDRLKAMKKKDYFYKQHSKKYNNQIMILDLACEFIEKFQSADASAMADYIFLNANSKLKKTSIVNYFRNMLGFSVTIRINMHGKDKDSIVDDKYNYMQDDFTPDEARWAKRMHRKNKKKLCPEANLYEYF